MSGIQQAFAFIRTSLLGTNWIVAATAVINTISKISAESGSNPNIIIATTGNLLSLKGDGSAINWQKNVDFITNGGDALAIDSSNNSYNFGQNLTQTPYCACCTTQYYNNYSWSVVKANSSGTQINQKAYISSTLDTVVRIFGATIDSSGNLIFCGEENNGSIGGLYKLSSSFAYTKLATFSSSYRYGYTAICVDNATNAYLVSSKSNSTGGLGVTGIDYTSGSAFFNSQVYFTSGTALYPQSINITTTSNLIITATDVSSYMGIWSYAASGFSVNWWHKLTPSNGNVVYGQTVLDSSDNIYIAWNAINTTNTNLVILVTKYNSSGTLQWNRQISISGKTLQVYSITTAGTDYVIGCMNLTDNRMFICRLPLDGSKTGTYSVNFGTSLSLVYGTPTITITETTPSTNASSPSTNSTGSSLIADFTNTYNAATPLAISRTSV